VLGPEHDAEALRFLVFPRRGFKAIQEAIAQDESGT
jgi:hypothetical protein